MILISTTVMKIKKPENEIYVRAFIYSRERIGKPVPYRDMVLLAELYETKIPRWERGEIKF